MCNSFQTLLVVALAGLVWTAGAVTPQPEELLAWKTWSDGVFPGGGETGSGAILKFQYGGASSAELLGQWSRKAEERAPGEHSTRRDLVYLDPATGLELRVQTERFTDFPAVEWVVSLANHGTTNTPLLEDIQALDDVLPVPTSGEATLHWAKGGVASFDDFAPQTTVLKAGRETPIPPGRRTLFQRGVALLQPARRRRRCGCRRGLER